MIPSLVISYMDLCEIALLSFASAVTDVGLLDCSLLYGMDENINI